MHLLVSGAALVGLLNSLSGVDPVPPPPARSVDLLVRNHTGGTTIGNDPEEMALFNGGSFTMGIGEKDLEKLQELDADSVNAMNLLCALYPQHKVELSAFYLDRKETTNIQYRTYLNANGLQPSAALIEYCWSYWDKGERVEGKIPPGQDLHPVRGITFFEAEACAKWMGKRLPTEEEWEFGARYGLQDDQIHPWAAKSWEGWDPTKNINSSNSSQGSEGYKPFPVGSWEGDRTPAGLYDLCGNAAEWTASPFSPFPGWEPLELKVRKIKRKFRAEFNSEQRVIRGGSFMGNRLSNNLVSRWGIEPGSVAEGIGFRCAMSGIPGMDILREAEAALSLLNGGVRGNIEMDTESVAAQTVISHNPKSDVITGSSHLAFARATRINKSQTKLDSDSVEEPVLVGILYTSRDALAPKLPRGNYAIYYKGKGESEAYKEAEKQAKAEEKNGKTPKDAEKKPDDEAPSEKKPEEMTDEERKQLAEERAAQSELEKIGAVTAPKLKLLEIPHDQPILMFKNDSGDTIAWMPARRDDVKLHATTLRYVAGGANGSKAMVAATSKAPIQKTTSGDGNNDLAEIKFTVRTAASTRYPEFTITLEFAPGAFTPVEPPEADGKK